MNAYYILLVSMLKCKSNVQLITMNAELILKSKLTKWTLGYSHIHTIFVALCMFEKCKFKYQINSINTNSTGKDRDSIFCKLLKSEGEESEFSDGSEVSSM
jgi:hypothetical protein